jgi:hypothetical protein
MSEVGQPPEAGPEEPGKPVEGAAQAVYDGPIEKFKGKTATEIAQIYSDLESSYGKKDAEIKAYSEKLEGYEQWYRNQQAQQQQIQQPPVPQTPPDIYDNPHGFVQQAAQPLIEKAVEQTKFQNALSMAPIMKNQAKQNYPEVFEGVDEVALEKVMYNGVKTGTVHYSALADEHAWKMAAWQMKGEGTGYKATGPNPVAPTQTEQPSGGPGEEELSPMTQEHKDWAAAMGKDTKTAQRIWEQTQKQRKVEK